MTTFTIIKVKGKNIIIKEELGVSKVLHPDQLKESLSLIWNIGEPNDIVIDDTSFHLGTNCILFVSEFYMKIDIKLSSLRIITFDKTFLSPINSNNLVGEYLMLFYGSHAIYNIPKITLQNEEIAIFNELWVNLEEEYMNIQNPISEALLRNTFTRILLLSQKIHMNTYFDIPIGFNELRSIREFQYLVNNNFKEFTKVSDYAKIMNVSAKKISELFSCCYDRKASELIADRRNLYAQRQLKHTNELIKNIAYDLNFSDSQTFSHFFKKQNKITPESFRKKNNI